LHKFTVVFVNSLARGACFALARCIERDRPSD
jgi:hypothetical protein